MTVPTSSRIRSLDTLRGAAVLGILVANLPGYALPAAAYFSPAAWGGTSTADLIAWALTFILVEGKMRGLFAALFGASMLLVIQRADARGENGAAVHLRRMGTLFLIGCAHLYLVWGGDILTLYALTGCIALFFTGAPVRLLLAAALAALFLTLLNGVALLNLGPSIETAFGRSAPTALWHEITALRGPWSANIEWRWGENADPLTALLANGPETLAYMLLGMAGLRTGFLTGAWTRRRYAVIAAITLGMTLPIYSALAWRTVAHSFDAHAVVLASFVVTPLLRPVTVIGYAALLLLAAPTRLADVGRVALSNYLACSVAFTALFYGWGAGEFGHWPRAALYPLILPAWTVMLLWPQWWLRRFTHGPVEWAWRCSTQRRLLPLRRQTCERDAI